MKHTIDSYDKAIEVLEGLERIVKHMNYAGIPPPYTLKIVDDIWKSLVKYLLLNKILTFFRANRIKGVDIFTSYGVKKIRIWL